MTETQGLTWIGRRPWLAVPVLVMLLPMYLVFGAVCGMMQILVESWLLDLREVTRRR